MRAFSNGGLTADTSNWCTPFTFITTSSTGIDENNFEQLALYPNPARDNLFLRINSNGAGTVHIILFDLLGKKVLEQDVDLTSGQNIKEISLDNVKEGIYIARITTGSNTTNQKIVVRK